MPDTAHDDAGLPVIRASPHGHLTALSMMKDEGPFLLEWIAHHLAVGFTRIVVYTNDCTDGTDAMLMRLETLGLAHHRVNRIARGMKPQPSALKHAQVDPLVGESDWLLVLDADEFLCIRHGDGSLGGLLDAATAEGANGIVVTWRIFGSGGIRDWCRDFVTEQYLMAAPPIWNKGWGVKTLFRFDPEIWKLGIHRPKMKNKVLDTDFPQSVKWLNGSGREMEEYFKFRGWRSIMRTVGYDWAQMNHYAVKSVDSYAIRKLRGNVNNKADKYDGSYWALQDRNEVRDDTMLRYADARRAVFERLLADPVLARLHDAATAEFEARLAKIKAGPAYEGFVADLRAASRVPITRVEAKPPKLRDAAAIADKMKDVEKRTALKRQTEKEKPTAERLLMPVDSHVRGPLDMSADPPMEWHRNHSVELPADPRIFTPPALVQVAEGKFERNLARLLPRLLPRSGRYVEIGAGSGFLAAQLALERPDLWIAVAEADPQRRTFINRLWARNGLAPSEALCLLGDLAPPAASDAPVDLLVLGDPSLPLDRIAEMARAWNATRIAVTGRLWVEIFPDLPALSQALARLGLDHRLPADPAIAAIFARPPDPEVGT